MESVDPIEEYQGHLTSGVGMLERQKMGKFGQLVDDNQDHLEAIGLW